MNSKYVFYVGVLLTLLASFISFYTSFFDYIENKENNAVFSLLIAILGLIITDRISTIEFFGERLEKSIRDINSQERIETFTNARQAIEYFVNIEKPILIIKNTSFKFISDRKSNMNQLYAQGLRNKWYKNKKKLVGKNVEWREVGNFNQDSVFNDFKDWSESDDTRRYYVSKMSVNFASSNFLYILFEDGSEEVLFGWSYAFSRPMDNPVFRSRNVKMCKYYSSLFDFIEGNCTESDA